VAEPEHQVTLTHDFLLGTTEITNQQFLEAAQWAVNTGNAMVTSNQLFAYGVVLLDLSSTYCEITYNSGQFSLRGAPGAGDWGFSQATTYDPYQHPVKMVSWYGAACYCDWLSQMNGLPAYYNGNWAQIPSPNNPYAATGYRLPTEAEWEFAAQFNDERTFPWGEAEPTCELVNGYVDGFCVGWTCPVGTNLTGASSLGLLDMSGNVYEWNNDWYTEYDFDPELNPEGPSSGSFRIIRGGSFIESRPYLTCALRPSNSSPMVTYPYIGFRLCRTRP
jgi:formylglycine-generating enzyme required for sulfatase activity